MQQQSTPQNSHTVPPPSLRSSLFTPEEDYVINECNIYILHHQERSLRLDLNDNITLKSYAKTQLLKALSFLNHEGEVAMQCLDGVTAEEAAMLNVLNRIESLDLGLLSTDDNDPKNPQITPPEPDLPFSFNRNAQPPTTLPQTPTKQNSNQLYASFNSTNYKGLLEQPGNVTPALLRSPKLSNPSQKAILQRIDELSVIKHELQLTIARIDILTMIVDDVLAGGDGGKDLGLYLPVVPPNSPSSTPHLTPTSTPSQIQYGTNDHFITNYCYKLLNTRKKINITEKELLRTLQHREIISHHLHKFEVLISRQREYFMQTNPRALDIITIVNPAGLYQIHNISPLAHLINSSYIPTALCPRTIPITTIASISPLLIPEFVSTLPQVTHHPHQSGQPVKRDTRSLSNDLIIINSQQRSPLANSRPLALQSDPQQVTSPSNSTQKKEEKEGFFSALTRSIFNTKTPLSTNPNKGFGPPIQPSSRSQQPPHPTLSSSYSDLPGQNNPAPALHSSDSVSPPTPMTVYPHGSLQHSTSMLNNTSVFPYTSSNLGNFTSHPSFLLPSPSGLNDQLIESPSTLHQINTTQPNPKLDLLPSASPQNPLALSPHNSQYYSKHGHSHSQKSSLSDQIAELRRAKAVLTKIYSLMVKSKLVQFTPIQQFSTTTEQNGQFGSPSPIGVDFDTLDFHNANFGMNFFESSPQQSNQSFSSPIVGHASNNNGTHPNPPATPNILVFSGSSLNITPHFPTSAAPENTTPNNYDGNSNLHHPNSDQNAQNVQNSLIKLNHTGLIASDRTILDFDTTIPTITGADLILWLTSCKVVSNIQNAHIIIVLMMKLGIIDLLTQNRQINLIQVYDQIIQKQWLEVLLKTEYHNLLTHLDPNTNSQSTPTTPGDISPADFKNPQLHDSAPLTTRVQQCNLLYKGLSPVYFSTFRFRQRVPTNESFRYTGYLHKFTKRRLVGRFFVFNSENLSLSYYEHHLDYKQRLPPTKQYIMGAISKVVSIDVTSNPYHNTVPQATPNNLSLSSVSPFSLQPTTSQYGPSSSPMIASNHTPMQSMQMMSPTTMIPPTRHNSSSSSSYYQSSQESSLQQSVSHTSSSPGRSSQQSQQSHQSQQSTTTSTSTQQQNNSHTQEANSLGGINTPLRVQISPQFGSPTQLSNPIATSPHSLDEKRSHSHSVDQLGDQKLVSSTPVDSIITHSSRSNINSNQNTFSSLPGQNLQQFRSNLVNKQPTAQTPTNILHVHHIPHYHRMKANLLSQQGFLHQQLYHHPSNFLTSPHFFQQHHLLQNSTNTNPIQLPPALLSLSQLPAFFDFVPQLGAYYIGLILHECQYDEQVILLQCSSYTERLQWLRAMWRAGCNVDLYPTAKQEIQNAQNDEKLLNLASLKRRRDNAINDMLNGVKLEEDYFPGDQEGQELEPEDHFSIDHVANQAEDYIDTLNKTRPVKKHQFGSTSNQPSASTLETGIIPLFAVSNFGSGNNALIQYNAEHVHTYHSPQIEKLYSNTYTKSSKNLPIHARSLNIVPVQYRYQYDDSLLTPADDPLFDFGQSDGYLDDYENNSTLKLHKEMLKKVIYGTVQTCHLFDDQFLYKRTSSLFREIDATGTDHGVRNSSHFNKSTSFLHSTPGLNQSLSQIDIVDDGVSKILKLEPVLRKRVELQNDGSQSKLFLILRPEQFHTNPTHRTNQLRSQRDQYCSLYSQLDKKILAILDPLHAQNNRDHISLPDFVSLLSVPSLHWPDYLWNRNLYAISEQIRKQLDSNSGNPPPIANTVNTAPSLSTLVLQNHINNNPNLFFLHYKSSSEPALPPICDSLSHLERNMNQLYLSHYRSVRQIYATKSPLPLPAIIAYSQSQLQNSSLLRSTTGLLSPTDALSNSTPSSLLTSVTQFTSRLPPSHSDLPEGLPSVLPPAPIATSTTSHLPLILHPFDDVLEQFNLRDALTRISLGLTRMYSHSTQNQHSQGSIMAILNKTENCLSQPFGQVCTQNNVGNITNLGGDDWGGYKHEVIKLLELFQICSSTHLFTKLSLQPNHIAALSKFINSLSPQSLHHSHPHSPALFTQLLTVLRSHIEYITLTSFQLPTSLPILPIPLQAPSPTRELSYYHTFQVLKQFFFSQITTLLPQATKQTIISYANELPTIPSLIMALKDHNNQLISIVDATEDLWNMLLLEHIYTPFHQIIDSEYQFELDPNSSLNEQPITPYGEGLLRKRLASQLSCLHQNASQPLYQPIQTCVQKAAIFFGKRKTAQVSTPKTQLFRSPSSRNPKNNPANKHDGLEDEKFTQITQSNFLFRFCISESTLKPLPTSLFDLSILPYRSIQLGISNVETSRSNPHNAPTVSYGEQISKYLETECFFSSPIIQQKKDDNQLDKFNEPGSKSSKENPIEYLHFPPVLAPFNILQSSDSVDNDRTNTQTSQISQTSQTSAPPLSSSSASKIYQQGLQFVSSLLYNCVLSPSDFSPPPDENSSIHSDLAQIDPTAPPAASIPTLCALSHRIVQTIAQPLFATVLIEQRDKLMQSLTEQQTVLIQEIELMKQLLSDTTPYHTNNNQSSPVADQSSEFNHCLDLPSQILPLALTNPSSSPQFSSSALSSHGTESSETLPSHLIQNLSHSLERIINQLRVIKDTCVYVKYIESSPLFLIPPSPLSQLYMSFIKAFNLTYSNAPHITPIEHLLNNVPAQPKSHLGSNSNIFLKHFETLTKLNPSIEIPHQTSNIGELGQADQTPCNNDDSIAQHGIQNHSSMYPSDFLTNPPQNATPQHSAALKSLHKILSTFLSGLDTILGPTDEKGSTFEHFFLPIVPIIKAIITPVLNFSNPAVERLHVEVASVAYAATDASVIPLGNSQNIDQEQEIDCNDEDTDCTNLSISDSSYTNSQEKSERDDQVNLDISNTPPIAKLASRPMSNLPPQLHLSQSNHTFGSQCTFKSSGTSSSSSKTLPADPISNYLTQLSGGSQLSSTLPNIPQDSILDGFSDVGGGNQQKLRHHSQLLNSPSFMTTSQVLYPPAIFAPYSLPYQAPRYLEYARSQAIQDINNFISVMKGHIFEVCHFTTVSNDVYALYWRQYASNSPHETPTSIADPESWGQFSLFPSCFEQPLDEDIDQLFYPTARTLNSQQQQQHDLQTPSVTQNAPSTDPIETKSGPSYYKFARSPHVLSVIERTLSRLIFFSISPVFNRLYQILYCYKDLTLQQRIQYYRTVTLDKLRVNKQLKFHGFLSQIKKQFKISPNLLAQLNKAKEDSSKGSNSIVENNFPLKSSFQSLAQNTQSLNPIISSPSTRSLIQIPSSRSLDDLSSKQTSMPGEYDYDPFYHLLLSTAPTNDELSPPRPVRPVDSQSTPPEPFPNTIHGTISANLCQPPISPYLNAAARLSLLPYTIDPQDKLSSLSKIAKLVCVCVDDAQYILHQRRSRHRQFSMLQGSILQYQQVLVNLKLTRKRTNTSVDGNDFSQKSNQRLISKVKDRHIDPNNLSNASMLSQYSIDNIQEDEALIPLNPGLFNNFSQNNEIAQKDDDHCADDDASLDEAIREQISMLEIIPDDDDDDDGGLPLVREDEAQKARKYAPSIPSSQSTASTVIDPHLILTKGQDGRQTPHFKPMGIPTPHARGRAGLPNKQLKSQLDDHNQPSHGDLDNFELDSFSLNELTTNNAPQTVSVTLQSEDTYGDIEYTPQQTQIFPHLSNLPPHTHTQRKQRPNHLMPTSTPGIDHFNPREIHDVDMMEEEGQDGNNQTLSSNSKKRLKSHSNASLITPLVPDALVSHADNLQNRLLMTATLLLTTVEEEIKSTSFDTFTTRSINSIDETKGGANKTHSPLQTPSRPSSSSSSKSSSSSHAHIVPITPTLPVAPGGNSHNTKPVDNDHKFTSENSLGASSPVNKEPSPGVFGLTLHLDNHNEPNTNLVASSPSSSSLQFKNLKYDIPPTTDHNSSLISSLSSSTLPYSPSQSHINIPMIPATPATKENKPLIIGAEDLLILTVIVLTRSSDMSFLRRLIECMEQIKKEMVKIEHDETEMMSQLSTLYQRVKKRNHLQNQPDYDNNPNQTPILYSDSDSTPQHSPLAGSTLSTSLDRIPSIDSITAKSVTLDSGANWDIFSQTMGTFKSNLENNTITLETKLDSLALLLSSNIHPSQDAQNLTDSFASQTNSSFLSTTSLTQDYHPGPSNFASQMQLIDDFILEQDRYTMSGYYFATTQAAVELLLTHEPNQLHDDGF